MSHSPLLEQLYRSPDLGSSATRDRQTRPIPSRYLSTQSGKSGKSAKSGGLRHHTSIRPDLASRRTTTEKSRTSRSAPRSRSSLNSHESRESLSEKSIADDDYIATTPWCRSAFQKLKSPFFSVIVAVGLGVASIVISIILKQHNLPFIKSNGTDVNLPGRRSLHVSPLVKRYDAPMEPTIVTVTRRSPIATVARRALAARQSPSGLPFSCRRGRFGKRQCDGPPPVDDGSCNAENCNPESPTCRCNGDGLECNTDLGQCGWVGCQCGSDDGDGGDDGPSSTASSTTASSSPASSAPASSAPASSAPASSAPESSSAPPSTSSVPLTTFTTTVFPTTSSIPPSSSSDPVSSSSSAPVSSSSSPVSSSSVPVSSSLSTTPGVSSSLAAVSTTAVPTTSTAPTTVVPPPIVVTVSVPGAGPTVVPAPNPNPAPAPAPNPAPAPAAGQPAAGQPNPPAGQVVPAEPPAGQPAAGQPAGAEPVAGQPAAGQPAAGQPAAGQPAAGQPAPQAAVPNEPAAVGTPPDGVAVVVTATPGAVVTATARAPGASSTPQSGGPAAASDSPSDETQPTGGTVVPLGPVAAGVSTFGIMAGVTGLTEINGYAHAATLRTALAQTGQLGFNTNLRIWTTSGGMFSPNGPLSNGLHLAGLLFSYSAASMVFVGIQGGQAIVSWIPLLVLGIATAGTGLLAWLPYLLLKYLSTTNSPLEMAAACVAAESVNPRPGRCTFQVHESKKKMHGESEARELSEVKPSAWEARASARRVVYFTWLVAIGGMIWAIASLGYLGPRTGFPSQSWVPMSGPSTAAITIRASTNWNIVGADVLLDLLIITLIQLFWTIALNFAELVLALSRDESDWRMAATEAGATAGVSPFWRALTSWQSLSLLAIKPFVHWFFGEAIGRSTIVSNGKLVGALVMRPVQIFYLAIVFMGVAAFITWVARRRPTGPQPATFGHIQSICDLVDEWPHSNKLYWGHKAGCEVIEGHEHLGTSDEVLPPPEWGVKYA